MMEVDDFGEGASPPLPPVWHDNHNHDGKNAASETRGGRDSARGSSRLDKLRDQGRKRGHGREGKESQARVHGVSSSTHSHSHSKARGQNSANTNTKMRPRSSRRSRSRGYSKRSCSHKDNAETAVASSMRGLCSKQLQDSTLAWA